MSLSITIFNSIDDIDPDEYEKLKEQASGSVFYDRRFLEATEKSPLLPVEKNYYFVAYEGKRMVAFMPTYRQISPDPFGVLANTTSFQFNPQDSAFFNHIMHCYESMILVKDASHPLYQTMLHHLKAFAEKEKIKYCGLLNVIDKKFLLMAEQIGFHVNFMWDRFYINLSKFNTFDNFLSTLKRKSRLLFRTQLKRFQESDATIVIEKPPFQNLNEVAELCHATTSKYGTGHYYPPDTFASFIALCGDLIRLISVYYHGKRVGVVIALLEKNTLHLWACGMQYDDVPFSPYIVSIAKGFQYALDNHISVVEIGRTNGKMKEKLGFSPLPLYSVIHCSEENNEPI